VEKLWRWCRREPALAAAVFTLGAVLIGVAVGSFLFALRLEDARRAEAQERLRAEAMLTRLEIDRAHGFFDDGSSSRAIATLAHVLRRSPTNHVAAARLVSALTHRNFPFPVQSLSAGSKVVAAEFIAEGRQVVTVSEEGLVQRWDADSGTKAGEPVKVGNGLTSASFDQHHDWLAVGAARNLQVWNLRDNRRSAMIRPGPEDSGNFESVNLSPDGKRVLALIRSKVNSSFQVIVYDAATAAKLAIARHDEPVQSARFGPDGQHFVTTTSSGGVTTNSSGVVTTNSSGVRVWESSDGSLRLGPLRHTGVRTAEFSPDGKWIVSGANNKTTKVWNLEWDLKTGHERINFSAGHEFWIQSAKFSQDGTRIVTASADTTARLWETSTGRALMEPLRHLAPVTSATFQPDAQRVLTVAGEIVTIWDVRPRAAAPAAMIHDEALQAMEFSPAGTLLATVAKDRTLRLWNPRTGAPTGPALPLPDAPTSLVFSPDGRRLAVACANGEVTVWQVTDGLEKLASLPEAPEPTRAWGFTRDGRHLLTTVTKSASLWSLEAQPASRVVEFPHNAQLSAARLSPDGQRVVTASTDKSAQLWDAHTGAPVGQPMVHADFVHDAEFNADGSLLVTATRDREARVFDGRDGRPVTDKLRHHAHVRTASFSPDGLRVITASRDRTTRIWDARTGSPLLELPPAADELQSARFSPHGRLVLTSTIDHRAQVWDAFTGQAISEVFTHTLERNFAKQSSFAPRFAPDGLRIAAASDANAVKVWSLPELPAAAPAWLMELAECLAGMRYDGQGYREFSGFAELVRLRESLEHQPNSDGYNRWAKWFFADPSIRTPGPE
jgi:WD40 repeat protein